MAFGVSDDILSVFVPISMYWLYSGLYWSLDRLGVSDKYRLHPKEDEDTKNLASKGAVLKSVLLQQAGQVAVQLAIIHFDNGPTPKQPSLPVAALQFIVAMVVMDTYQYFVHRYMHTNKFLYKHVHSQHHTIVVPYAFGALYSNPIEGFFMDTVSATLGFLVSGMTPRTAIFFFSLANLKTVDDHCSMWLPWNPLHLIFGNNTAFHGIHHQLYGQKYNFSQPFFFHWDKVFGTYMSYTLEERKGGGLDARPIKHAIVAQGDKSD